MDERRMVAPIAIALAVAGQWLVVQAENIDPVNDGSQHAYAENVGWLNAEPSGDGGPGVEVADFELIGWMWGENVGWVSLSCKNRATCGAVHYGVTNDGNGVLAGHAWAENVGWIDFGPSTAGVHIDPVSGDFSGRAWGENVGWITFASTTPVSYKVRTAWNCDPPPSPPVDPPDLILEKTESDTALSWATVADATGDDVVVGSLSALRSSVGDYAAATTGCESNNNTDAALSVVDEPPVGDAIWFLIRGANCGGSGSYDTDGDAQAASRDEGISASGNDCS